MGAKTCACGCGRALPVDAHPRAKYLDEKHRRRVEARRYRARKRDESKDRRVDAKPLEDQSKEWKDRAESKDGRATARGGPGYDRFVAKYGTGVFRDINTGTTRVQDVVQETGESQANVSRWLANFNLLDSRDAAKQGWQRSPEVEAALDSFEEFNRRYFADNPYIGLMPAHHIKWAQAITETLNDGGRLLLLAPQRHGKTSMLIKYVMWRLCKNPNICIIWVGKSEAKAAESTGLVQQFFDEMTNLVEDVWGPGTDIHPGHRSGLSWTPSELVLSTRTIARKSPSLKAMGIDSNILGSDADLLVVDDPVELGGNKGMDRSLLNRDKAYQRLVTDINSRKMKRTGFAYITSRMHIDDPPGRIIKSHAQDWRIVVERAHDPGCTLIEDDHIDQAPCLLWPDAPDMGFEWLMEQKRQNPAHFQRNFQNDPRGDSTILISAEDLDRCKDRNRFVGDIPKGCSRLVAGIDPAPKKANAAVLWSFEPPSEKFPKGRRHIIDIMESEPGVRGGREIVRQWRETYKCSLFVLEENIAQGWWEDRDMSEFLSRSGAELRPFHTQWNKRDEAHGVLAMFAHMRKKDPTITFPWGDRASQQKMDRLLRVLLDFDPDLIRNKHVDDDLVMAMWFPMKAMDSWGVSEAQHAVVDYRQTPYVPTRTSYVPVRRLHAVEMEDVA